MGFNSMNANETWSFKRRNVAISEQQMAGMVIFEEEAPPAVTDMTKNQALLPFNIPLNVKFEDSQL
jgi:hypothetical protein